jgi:hypothetical protein
MRSPLSPGPIPAPLGSYDQTHIQFLLLVPSVCIDCTRIVGRVRAGVDHPRCIYSVVFGRFLSDSIPFRCQYPSQIGPDLPAVSCACPRNTRRRAWRLMLPSPLPLSHDSCSPIPDFPVPPHSRNVVPSSRPASTIAPHIRHPARSPGPSSPFPVPSSAWPRAPETAIGNRSSWPRLVSQVPTS